MANEVKKIADYFFVKNASGEIALNFSRSDTEEMLHVFNSISKVEQDPETIGGYKIVPFGSGNNLPIIIRNILEKNNLAPGILSRMIGLIWGQGPELYAKKYESGKIITEWVESKEIQEWLDKWDYKKYVREALTEYIYMHGYFCKYFPKQSLKIGEQGIAKLEVVKNKHARLGWTDTRDMRDVPYIITADFEKEQVSSVKKYSIFSKYEKVTSRVKMAYHSLATFGRDFYSFPSFFGTLPWINRANDIPEIIKYLTENMIAAAYHVRMPEQYWIRKRDTIMAAHPDWSMEKIEQELEVLREDFSKQIAAVLAGKRNVGKFIMTIDITDDNGNTLSVSIEPVKMNLKDYITAQAEISKIADSATTSGLGLHPSLSNIIINGQLNSGSQLLYALKLFLIADTALAEEIIFEPINSAIKINFKGSNLKMGFYHKVVLKEEDVTPDNRLNNE